MLLRHAIALLALIVAPLVVIGWLGTSAVNRQQETARQQLQSVLTERLVEVDRNVQSVTDQLGQTLSEQLRGSGRATEALRNLRLSEPAVRAALLVDRDGRLIYPPRPANDNPIGLAWHGSLSELARRRPIGENMEVTASSSSATSADKADFAKDSNGAPDRLTAPTIAKQASASRNDQRGSRPQAPQQTVVKPKAPAQPQTFQWQTWYHDNGLQLVLWVPWSDQTATGIVLERGRWMADILESLPSSVQMKTERNSTFSSRVTPTKEMTTGSFLLRDSGGQTVYRWGQPSEPGSAGVSLAQIDLSSPLSAWELAYQDDTINLSAGSFSSSLALVASLAATGVALLLLGGYVLTSMRRQMTLAQQRVSFASHVSHELRTPLTNIRLYAELARRDLQNIEEGNSGAADAKTKLDGRIHVIEEESQRLSRLVSGVLEMVSSGRNANNLRLRAAVPDDLIRQVLASFQPALERLDFEISLDLNANQEVSLDVDLVEMILVNLLSNVEKYAASGRSLEIASRQANEVTTIDVRDRGPGIKRSAAKRIFEPFERLDDSLSAPAGTGLGLAIARGGVRRHGGDLVLIPSEQGAHFRVTIPFLKQ